MGTVPGELQHQELEAELKRRCRRRRKAYASGPRLSNASPSSATRRTRLEDWKYTNLAPEIAEGDFSSRPQSSTSWRIRGSTDELIAASWRVARRLRWR